MIWFFVPLLTIVLLSAIILLLFSNLKVDNNKNSKLLMFLVRILECTISFLNHVFLYQ